MQLAIAEKARNQAAGIAEESAEEAEAYQAELRRTQAEQTAANREARETAKLREKHNC